MDVKELLAKCRTYLPPEKAKLVEEAYQFALSAHEGQRRRSGEPYIEHPLSTARYLADLRLDVVTLMAALLHDVVEDCDVTLEEIEERFGPEVAKLVDGVTKLTRMDLMTVQDGSAWQQARAYSEDSDHAASVRKMLVAMAEDIRVVLIKLADRLHNMRTLKALPPERRRGIAQETLDIYAPLAHRLGIAEIKWHLEDLAFRHLNPEAYRAVSRLVAARRAERDEYVARVAGVLKAELEKHGIRAQVTGRAKHLYSIYQKIQNYAAMGKEVGQIYDLLALRVLVHDIKECYSALGVVHQLWRPVPGQFDDYIANPKDNLYQSLHTTVLCLDNKLLEVQIRTYQMHRIAEYGVAAHWRYKEGSATDMHFEEKMTWLRQLLEWQREVSGAEEFLEGVKLDIFQDQVFVYTPKGEIKELPAGSTPLDFAYRIHTEIGHRCIGCKVNGKLVPLNYRLQSGDTVEILTTKASRGPSMDWLNPDRGYVKTASAREKIRQWFRKQERSASLERGREALHKELRRLSDEVEPAEVARLMHMESVEDLYVALGSGSVSINQITARLTAQQEVRQHPPTIKRPVGPSSGVEVVGVGDLLTRMAQCCTPVPGDEIIGFVTRTRGVTVHRKDCPNVVDTGEPERLVPVNWGAIQELHPVRIQIEAWDRVGLLRDITTRLSEERVNIASVVTEEHEDDSRASVHLTLYTTGLGQLSRLLSKLEGVQGVISVARSPLPQRNAGEGRNGRRVTRSSAKARMRHS